MEKMLKKLVKLKISLQRENGRSSKNFSTFKVESIEKEISWLLLEIRKINPELKIEKNEIRRIF